MHKIISLLLLAVAFHPYQTSAKDDTLTERATGKDVTEAALRIISRSNIFPDDYSFLIRLAYVESRFGQNNNTFRTDYYGGIWQVEESVFRITQSNHTSLTNLTQAIQTQFGITWSRLTWRDLLKPLHSGLAAALYFARVPVAIPDKIEGQPGQASHWRSYYRPLGDVNVFINDSESLREQTRCRGKLDLCILLDGSGSINIANYQRAKNFTASLIESFTLDYTRIGMIVFSNGTNEIFPIQNNLGIPAMANLARNASYPALGTRTDLGIFHAISMFNNGTSNQGVPRVLTVFTDGGSDRGSNMTGAIAGIRSNGIKSISVGIGGNLNNAELNLIALNDSQSVFYLQDFAALNDFLYTITSVACEVPQKAVINATISDTLLQDERRYYNVEIPTGGITITLSITSGKANGYWSRNETVPSSALHDGVISGSVFIPALGGGRQANVPKSVYVAVQGVEPMNNYTIRTTEGNTVGSGTKFGSTNTTFIFVFISLFSYLIFK